MTNRWRYHRVRSGKPHDGQTSTHWPLCSVQALWNRASLQRPDGASWSLKGASKDGNGYSVIVSAEREPRLSEWAGVPPSCSVGCAQGFSNTGAPTAYKRADPRMCSDQMHQTGASTSYSEWCSRYTKYDNRVVPPV